MTLNSSEHFIKIMVLTFPLIISGILHMIVVSLNIVPKLKKPIHLKAFGKNKTWRGLVVMPVFSWLALAFLTTTFPRLCLDTFGRVNYHTLGICLGLAYVLSELPNSYVKRRLGIEPGQRSLRYPGFFSMLDQTDSALGCAVVYYFWGIVDSLEAIMLVFWGTVLHLILNFLLYLLKLRKNPL